MAAIDITAIFAFPKISQKRNTCGKEISSLLYMMCVDKNSQENYGHAQCRAVQTTEQ